VQREIARSGDDVFDTFMVGDSRCGEGTLGVNTKLARPGLDAMALRTAE
jgi:hypothetical protein